MKSLKRFYLHDFTYSCDSRGIRPLCLVFFSPVWLLLAWCEKRNDFRNFRLDRIDDLTIMDEQFKDEVGKRLYDYCNINNYSID